MDETQPAASPFPVELGYLGRDFPFLLRSLRGYIRSATAETFAGLGTQPGDVAILNLIGINPGLSQNDLAAVLVLKKSAVTKAIKSLEQRGMIERRKGEDRRFNALRLTQEGEQQVARLRERMKAQHEFLFDGVAEERQAALFGELIRILHKLHRAGGVTSDSG